MSIRLRTVLLTAALLSAPASARALDDDLRAFSRGPTALTLCSESNSSRVKPAVCKDKGYDKLVAAINGAFDAALARTPANIRPLLKRDQVWFNEMIPGAVDIVEEMDDGELRDALVSTLRQRAATLDQIAAGFGRSGVAGTWRNAFGTAVIASDGSGGFKLALDISVNYGSDKHRDCKLNIAVTPSANGWIGGTIAAAGIGSADASPEIKLRRQGETLRIVMSDRHQFTDAGDGCDDLWQITGTYFATGAADQADKAETSFVAPTFDCTKPDTATEEEICSDPGLAANDQRLNRAWKALLPRLDDATRRALMEDQRNWLQAQTLQFPEFLHPAWEKRTSDMHYTADARDHVDGLQRERIALLEGFDETRKGLAGIWLAYNAIIKIDVEKDGRLTAKGWKWDQGDWKAGCEYDMKGKVAGKTFRSDEQGRNPDMLERDRAMLIVNRQDDMFAKKRSGKDDDDEAKCRRRRDISSTARLFPARASQDIDSMQGSIR